MTDICVFAGDELASYGFPDGHPFSVDRHAAYYDSLHASGLLERCCMRAPQIAEPDRLQLFHTPEYVDKVRRLSAAGRGYLDAGDTPAFAGVYEAAATVVGTTLAAVDAVMRGECSHAFNPIGGLHHARRSTASGFCVFNDCAIAIEHLRTTYGMRQILYVDIDAHHGDGVFYPYQEDEQVIFLDFHQHSRTLYPGTGAATEIGKGKARGTKRNVEMLPQSTDEDFQAQWGDARAFIDRYSPEFVLLQCGVDSLDGDPITDLRYSRETHAFVTRELIRYANVHCRGRLVALGGGGYNLDNIRKGWLAVIEAMLNA